ncbi:MAG TPA: Trp biosynthesis-associated membrane protein [Euzebyales bacterium]
MSRRTDVATLAPFLGVACALVLLGAGSATWTYEPVARSVGDVALVDTTATAGVEIAPLAVVVALAGVAGSIGLLATRGGARRMVALVLVVVGVAGVTGVGVGVARLFTIDGTVTLAPWLAVAGATGMLAAALASIGRPSRRMPARYEVDAAPADDEWRLASDTGGSDRHTSYASPSGATGRGDDEDDQR